MFDWFLYKIQIYIEKLGKQLFTLSNLTLITYTKTNLSKWYTKTSCTNDNSIIIQVTLTLNVFIGLLYRGIPLTAPQYRTETTKLKKIAEQSLFVETYTTQ